jgi:DeoR/GlpR family transcriptional regulator of sugar metabolism
MGFVSGAYKKESRDLIIKELAATFMVSRSTIRRVLNNQSFSKESI